MRRTERRVSARRSPTAGGFRVVASSGIDDPLLLQPQLYRSDDEDDREKHPAHRGGVTHPSVAEGVLDNLLDDDTRRSRGTSLRHHPHLVENLNVVDQADHDDEEARRREQRQRDMPETAPAPGPIEGG